MKNIQSQLADLLGASAQEQYVYVNFPWDLVWRAENEIERCELQEAYIDALLTECGLITSTYPAPPTVHELFVFVRATPEQRYRAALIVLMPPAK